MIGADCDVDDGHRAVDGHAHADVMNRLAAPAHASGQIEVVVLGVDQTAFDVPQPVVAPEALEDEGAPMFARARYRCGRKWHFRLWGLGLGVGAIPASAAKLRELSPEDETGSGLYPNGERGLAMRGDPARIQPSFSGEPPCFHGTTALAPCPKEGKYLKVARLWKTAYNPTRFK